MMIHRSNFFVLSACLLSLVGCRHTNHKQPASPISTPSPMAPAAVALSITTGAYPVPEPRAAVFNVTDPATVSAILSGINFTKKIDARGIPADPNAYMVMKMADGTFKLYAIAVSYQYLVPLGRWDEANPIGATAQALLRKNTAK